MWPRMDFWDTGWEGPMVPPFSSVVRAAVWDTVAGYVQQQLLLRKGVRIPTLGSFDTILEQVQVRAGDLMVQRPVFRLARNLADAHQLTDDKAYVPGDKLLEPLRYTHIAAATFVSVKRVVGCIQATMSLFSRCIGKGRNVALILKDIGMLLIESPRVQMKYYRDFLEMMTGKDTLKEVLLRVPGMLDLVIPRTATASSLTCSGHVIIFPEFELESVHGTLLRDYHNSPGKRLNEGRQKKAVLLRPPRQDEKERLLTGANTLCPGYTGEHSLEPGSLGGKPPPPEETPTGHQHPAGSTALSNSSRRKGPSLKHTSLAMKAFLQPGERRRE
ncbi:coiled-coil domain-containing protein 81-like isoform X2 [Cygnus olor]|uniref:coiled-coil domain-containing protein 81-like isoform X2 n=1 Tax=Cygnus olor TaxID=8869 RepID=UPI001ADE2F05|nr:coiled-coil domain-containing protein 81-like isoform X2 [Cygnus olor]